MNDVTSEPNIILIVDDSPTDLGVVVHCLENFGFKIIVACDGERGLKRLQFVRPDIILLDVMMPKMDGFEMCRRLKANEKTKDIPVIFMTALTGTEDKLKGFRLGGVDYVTKPLQHEEVLARVTTHLNLRDLTIKLQQTNQELSKANQKITRLNDCLKEENMRMSFELEMAHYLQQMLIPTEAELKKINNLDIAGFMEPTDEVGGDYYDVLQHNGRVVCGIGDVTGHGLESGLVMLMVQTAVRTLLNSEINSPETFLNIVNRTIYDNVKRMHFDKKLSLSLLDYQAGLIRLTGQHEEVLLVRENGRVEKINTIDLGVLIGMTANIAAFVSQLEIPLQPGEGIVLYTDGITEAQNLDNIQYGIERLCQIISDNWQKCASEIQKAIMLDVLQHIGEQKIFDDITLLILKQKP